VVGAVAALELKPPGGRSITSATPAGPVPLPAVHAPALRS
jgi:hypothetical protein